jgi:hypothetical protein
MNNAAFYRRLTLLNARIPAIELRDRREDEDSFGRTAAKVGAGAAGAAAIYGGASLLRGARRMKGEYGSGPTNPAQALTALKMGHQANVRDVRAGYGAAGQAGVQAGRSMELPIARLKQSAANAGRSAARVGTDVATAPGQVLSQINAASRKYRLKLGKGNISRFPLVVR